MLSASVLRREEAVCLARMRAGHSLDLGGYRMRVGLSGDGMCRGCNAEVESVGHVWKCASGKLARRVLGLHGEFGELCRDPLASLAHWRWWRRTRPMW